MSFTPLFMILGFIILIVVIWYINIYNQFIKYKNRIEESWSGIDVALKRRFNLIPNLINAVKGFVAHEAEVLDKESSRFAGSADMSGRMEEESNLSRSLNGLLALAEAYPDLKSNQNFISLQSTLNDVEQDILNARNRYNNAVRRFNTLTESFPSRIIAKKYNFSRADYFTLELATQREMTKVDFSSDST